MLANLLHLLPLSISDAIAELTVENLGDGRIASLIQDIGNGWWRLEVSIHLSVPVQKDRWELRLQPAFNPGPSCPGAPFYPGETSATIT